MTKGRARGEARSRARHTARHSAPHTASHSAPSDAAERLHRAALQLLRLARREDIHTGLSPARLSALSVLVFGGPSSLGDLAAAEQVSAPTMSRLVAELEREGWIIRRHDPEDARATRLAATAAARRLLLAGRARRLDALSRGLGAISATDQRAITQALPALHRLVGAMAALRVDVAPTETAGRVARRRFD